MKLYVTDTDEKFPEIVDRYDISDEMEDSTDVLILPGGLGAIKDLFGALELQKDILIYNKNRYYTSILETMFKSHYVNEDALLNIDIENEYENLLEKLEERNNGKTNDGKNSQLL